MASADAFSATYARVRHVSSVQNSLATPPSARPYAAVGPRRSQLQMGNNAAFGLFSPAVLAAKAVLGDKNLNILQQVNKSRGDVAYNVVDVELVDGIDWPEVQKALTTVPEVISSRFILGDTSLGGFGYAVNDPEHGYSV